MRQNYYDDVFDDVMVMIIILRVMMMTVTIMIMIVKMKMKMKIMTKKDDENNDPVMLTSM